MSEWKKTYLRDLIVIKNGKDHKKLKNGQYPVYGSGGIMRYADSYLYDQESVLLPRKGTLNNIQFVTEPFWTVDTCYYTVVNRDKVLPYFLYCCLCKMDIQSLNTGSAVPSMTFEKYYSIEVPIPPLSTQHRIASILSRYDSLIENYQKQIKLLEEAAQRLYKEWFIDLRFSGHENTNIIDGVPEGWEKKSITDVLEIKYGKDHKLLKEGTIPVYGTGGIMRYVEKSLFTGESVLIPRKGSLNNIMLVGGTFWTIDTMFYSIPKENNVAKIVYFYLKGVDMYSFNIGAAVPSMTVNILSGMKLLVPNEDVKNKFETIASKYFIRMHSLQSQLRLLTEARDRLLPKLMSGEIEI